MAKTETQDEAVQTAPALSPAEQDRQAFQAGNASARIADIEDRLPTKDQKLVERIVLTDGYDWVLRDPKDPKTVIERGLRVRGDVVAVTEAEARRGERGGFLGSETDLKRVVLGADAAESALPTEDELAALAPAEVLAYLANHTDDIDRVEEIENGRKGGARKEITKAIKVVRDFQES